MYVDERNVFYMPQVCQKSTFHPSVLRYIEHRIPIIIRYQQKQREEMERKRNEFIGSRPAVSPLDLNDNNNKIHIGNGKVRQMFDERRQRVTGIDKSYPLQPISSKNGPNNSGRQAKNTTFVKRSVNPNQNGLYEHSLKVSGHGGGSGDMKHFPQATTITTNKRFNKNAISSKLSDIDYIENEQIPDIFSQLDDIDSLDSGRRFGAMERKMANLNVGNNNNSGNSNTSNNIKLGPVITRKPMAHSSASSLNTNKRLPSQQLTKTRSIPMTPEKSTFGQKKDSSWPNSPARKVTNGNISSGSISSSTRSSASSTASANKVQMASPPPEGMVACGICGRHFNEDRIAKHETICKKTSTKKRKIFDATKHRVQGTEAEVYVKKTQKTKKKPEESSKKTNWRRTHEEFIQAIRSAKQVQQHLAKGGKLSDLPPPPPSENPDYVQCPTCNRRFNEAAAARHIPKCASYQFNKPKTNPKSTSNLGKKRF
ncbi:ankyrin repeat-containing protein kinase A isoform X2 [Contarinia nasturtii]|uniref:ankyrin repeat-containing protein kinase A isoform X2 n=1 Tax=Contarinia nasturtii TaxID=265458 RepID=UPI0012D41F50|nr:ankyrin repeat-containing protein kinase A isoform X2 [Contarinia nasturtii]